MLRTHKIELKPNNKQATFFAKSCGVRRFAYNWGLAEWGRQYKAGEKPSAYAISKSLNAIKREQFPWMYEVGKNAAQVAIIDLGVAFKNFFRRVKQGAKPGYPKFKKKGNRDSFRADNGIFKGKSTARVSGRKIKLPSIGWVRMTHALRFEGQIRQVNISKTAGKWFAAILVDTIEAPINPCKNQAGVVGVDLGITHFATLSTGEKIEGPKALKKAQKTLRMASKSVSRKQKGSSNRKKAVDKLARVHYRISNIRKDAIHKLTHRLTTQYKVVVLEDLNIQGMLKNRKLSRNLSDQSLYEFRRQVEYKSKLYGSTVHIADRWFPSSKLCSTCGVKADKLPLSTRKWACENCGCSHDRDVNAAINLKNLAVGSTVTACGEESSDSVGNHNVKLSSMNQETNSEVCSC